MTLPIAECFCAPQGEGKYAGTLMIFLRLAGCTIGRRFDKERYTSSSVFPMLPMYTNECTTWDGRKFACDTDYSAKTVLSEDGILALLKSTHSTCKVVCITGGEPLMHFNSLEGWTKLVDLTNILTGAGYILHLETSGTVSFPPSVSIARMLSCFTHAAISPKIGFLDEYAECADEIKLLVDKDFSVAKLPPSLAELVVAPHPALTPPIWIQPVNQEHVIDVDNMSRCLALQLEYPSLRISSQSHKLWGTR